MKSSSLLVITGLSKSYQVGDSQQEVLRSLDFSLDAGEQVAIVGESGAGKSTLLNLVAGLDHFDRGELKSCGYDIASASPAHLAEYRNRDLGFIFQFHYLLEDFNLVENIAMPALITGVESRKTIMERAHYLLEQVGLKARAKAYPSRLSGGERQRVAVARALMNRPKIILADEPTGSLDAKHAEIVFNLLRELIRSENGALLLVTHDMALAGRCARQLVLHK